MDKRFRRHPLLLLLVIICLSFSNGTFAEAKPVHTGLFGIYAWGDWNDALNIVRDNGFDIVIDASTKNALDMCQARGLKSFVGDFRFSREMIHDEVKWQQFLAGVRDKVTALKSHPALFGWYLVDEPDGQNVPISKIKAMNALVRSIDSKHPVMTVLADKDKWVNYVPYYDVIMIDPYLRKNIYSVPDTPKKVQDYIRKMKRDMRRLKVSKPLWVVLGAFDYIPRSPDDFNEFIKPTPTQFNEMVNYAVGENVDGILVWTFATRNHPRFEDWSLIKNEPALWEVVRKLPARATIP